MTKRILTGLKPTGQQLHLGNYFGAIAPFLDLQKQMPESEFFLFLANMHGFTQTHNPEELKQNSLTITKLYLACGVDLSKTLIYNPALIPAHAQLNRVLTCLTIMGTMERMHSYKDALAKGKAGETGVGTFCYPILMAADILLYDADLIPVGKDQKQHLEYARDIAQKFNNAYGETFKLPEPYIQESLATIIGTDGRKMSKSYNNYIGLLDDEATLLKKIKQIPTDAKAIEEPKDPDACNVFALTQLFLTAEEEQELRKKYLAGGLSYKYAKEYLFEKMKEKLIPIQQAYSAISDDQITQLLQKHSQQANEIASEKLDEVYQTIGFIL
ncbi:MAG: tryptophan--tRNA ligase [candidate division SR1 bacterium]|nr:MAG: tryptophan--tRNA ligase [candidate division SR1 bacterium]